ncbi:hypothetical protein E3J74_08555 [Candidatus Bathyarchaeota archaeon]|nr:MAG: hypothetical protein E3J74_08555 [Candidatus Bathyarchaeota archaeon]
MNKKFLVALILPLLLIPLASFAYAHNYDYVEKKYKLHVGTMWANITYFHVDYAKVMDQDNDGEIFDDELNITVFEDNCIWKVHIEVDPVSGGFVLNTTMEITNLGDLPWTVTWARGAGGFWPRWGNSTEDLCWDEEPTKSFPMWPSELWSWEIKYYKDNSTKGGAVYPAAVTEHKYKPGDVFRVVQHINLIQPGTDLEAELYKEIMGSWFYIWEIFMFESEDLIEDSSWTFGTPTG